MVDPEVLEAIRKARAKELRDRAEAMKYVPKPEEQDKEVLEEIRKSETKQRRDEAEAMRIHRTGLGLFYRERPKK